MRFPAWGAKTTSGCLATTIAELLKAYSKEDPYLSKSNLFLSSWSVTLSLALQTGPCTNDLTRATADFIVLGYFFLLRPGKHAKFTCDATAFRL